MRKVALGVLVVAIFVSGLVIGLTPPQADAASCYYVCKCVGAAYVPHKCCITPYGESCKIDLSAPINCLDVACRAAD
jgi:hypothetical protein